MVTAILSVLLCLSAQATAQDVPQWVEDAASRRYEAIRDSDVEIVTAGYSADAVIVVSGTTNQAGANSDTRLHGRDAIASYFEKDLAQTHYECSWWVYEVLESDELTAVSGTDTCIETSLQDGTDRKVTSRWMSIYKQQPDESWLVIFENL